MQYDPIKKSLGTFFSNPPFMRRIFYSLLDLLLLRTWHVRKALRKISAALPVNASVLDAGCGFGQYTYRMVKMNGRWMIRAVDINPALVEECRKFFGSSGIGKNVISETADLTQLDEKEKYNLILSVDVMEHITDDEKVFMNFYRSLKPGGFILISTPSDKGGSDVHHEGERSFIEEHVRNGYGVAEIADKLAAAGFININPLYTYGKPGKISWLISMKYPIRMLNISKLFFIILPFYYLLFFPVALILNIFDLYLNHKEGTGLIVTANK